MRGITRSVFNSSNFARVNVSLKSLTAWKFLISIFVLVCEDSVRLAFSTSCLSFPIALGSVVMSVLCLSLYCSARWVMTRWSQGAVSFLELGSREGNVQVFTA